MAQLNHLNHFANMINKLRLVNPFATKKKCDVVLLKPRTPLLAIYLCMGTPMLDIFSSCRQNKYLFNIAE